MRATLPIAVLAAVCAALPAQADGGRRALAEAIAQSPHAVPECLCVKLVEGSGAEVVDGRLRSRCGRDLGAVEVLLAGARVEPLFTALPWDELDRWHRRAVANCPPGRGPGHLGLWLRVTLPSADAARALWPRLWACPLVEHVENEAIPTPASLPMPAPVPGDIPPPTPSFTSLQHALEASPTGHGIWQAQGCSGPAARASASAWSRTRGTTATRTSIRRSAPTASARCRCPTAPPTTASPAPRSCVPTATTTG
ncbi:MAG: hypothetical protein U1E73_08435 [Planctomycetota bacterium]